MQPLTRFSLIDVDRARGRATVAVDGRPSGLAIEGLRLEEQFQLGDGSALIFVTEDSPYDEGLHVYLLAEDGTLIDALEAGAAFTSGILKIRGATDNWVDLEFFANDLVYRLEISDKPHLRLSLPRGWKYKNWLSRHRLAVGYGRRPENG